MNKKLQKSFIAALSLLWSFAFSGQALGQIAEDETTVTYPRSYFDQYAPVTAKDMLDRIPGLGSTTGGGPPSGGGFRGSGGGGGGRGFGSGSGSSEILINGKRTAGKNNQTSSVLRAPVKLQVPAAPVTTSCSVVMRQKSANRSNQVSL